MADRHELRFLLNDREIRLDQVSAADTLLDFLRIDQRLTGTKEGCAEGDCGACTVLVGRVLDGALRYENVNACIRFLASVDGCHVVTIEHLRGPDGALHPVQQAMVDLHGSQCGFCTPGIVMSLYALWMSNPAPNDASIETALQGNLCRCTGYEPILSAAKAAADAGGQERDILFSERDSVIQTLTKMQDGNRVTLTKGDDTVILPADTDDFASVYADMPEATVVAGATDVGLWVTKFLRPISPVVHIGHLTDLKSISVSESAIEIGAGVTYSEAEDIIAQHFPHLPDYWSRIGGWQVRNMGTIGGNIANGSPIGDTPPVLIALGAELTLRHGDNRRTMPLEQFFVDYGKQDRAKGEFVECIRIPLLIDGQLHAAYKISKRRDEDISSVAAGISITVSDDVITEARIALGGMAATPKRATESEAALVGSHFNADSFDRAATCLPQDFAPLSDWRASADYRMRVAQNLLRRFWLEHGTDDTVRLERA